MTSLLRILLIVGGLFVLYLVLFNPRQLGWLGRKAKVVAYAYVAAILISAALRLTTGWGT